MSLFTNDPQSRDVQLRSIRPHALFSFEPSLSLFQTATTDPGHGTKMFDRCRGSSAGNPSPLTRYGQNGWYPPAGSHDASGGAGRGADTQS